MIMQEERVHALSEVILRSPYAGMTYATVADRLAWGQGCVVFVFYSQRLVFSVFRITTHLG